MNKILFVAIILFLGLTGCSANDAEPDEAVAQSDQEVDVSTESLDELPETVDEGISVDRSLFDVSITMPATMVELEDQDIDSMIEEAQEMGVKEVVRNEDGSLTYKMSKSTHRKMMQEIKEDMIENIEDMVESGDFVSIKDVTYNNDFSEMTLIVDQKAFENSFDGFAVFGIGMIGMYYQLFDGVQPDNIQTTIYLKNVDTGEIFNKIVYPDAFDDLGEN